MPGPWTIYDEDRWRVDRSAHGARDAGGPDGSRRSTRWAVPGDEAHRRVHRRIPRRDPALLDRPSTQRERERDEARAETADLRATVDTMQVQPDAHREWFRDGAGHWRGGERSGYVRVRLAHRARGPSVARPVAEVEYPHRVRVFHARERDRIASGDRERGGTASRRWSPRPRIVRPLA